MQERDLIDSVIEEQRESALYQSDTSDPRQSKGEICVEQGLDDDKNDSNNMSQIETKKRYFEDSREFHNMYLRKETAVEDVAFNESNFVQEDSNMIFQEYKSLLTNSKIDRQGGGSPLNAQRKFNLLCNKNVELLQRERRNQLTQSFKVAGSPRRQRKSTSVNQSASQDSEVNSIYQQEKSEDSLSKQGVISKNLNDLNLESSMKFQSQVVKSSAKISSIEYNTPKKNQDQNSYKSRRTFNFLDSQPGECLPNSRNSKFFQKGESDAVICEDINNNTKNLGLKQSVSLENSREERDKRLNKILSNFQRVNLTKRFVKKMKQMSQQYNWRKIQNKQLSIISDIIQIQSQKAKKFSCESLVLLPNEAFSLIWEVLEIIFLFFHVVAFGLLVGFDIRLSEFLQAFSIVFYFIDLLVIINTGYYSGLEIIIDRISILKFNLSHIAMIIISLIALVFSDKGPVQFVFIFRIGQLFRSYHHFEQNFQLRQKFPVIATLLHLCLIIVLLAHYNACGFVFFTKTFSDPEFNWIQSIGLADREWQVQYIAALYFSFITMVTVGYGDIVPKTTVERSYTIVFVLISAIIFAYVVNTIGSLFQELSKQEDKLNQKKFEILTYMEEKNISHSIQISLLKFLEYTLSQEKELHHSISGEQFLQSIPQKLRLQVNQEYYGRILQKIKMFSMNFSKEFIQDLSTLMKEKTLGPGEEIFKQGDSNDTFFFINKGQVEFDVELQNKSIINLGILNKGEAFNHKGLFVDVIHTKTAKCKQITQIVYLSKADFLSVLKQNKDEYEKYCMIKDKHIQNRFDLGEKCLCCDEFGHTSLQCRLIQFRPQKQNIIAKNQYSVIVYLRTPYLRNKNKRPNSLAINEEVRQSLRVLRYELTAMVLGQNQISSYQELNEKSMTDEQFFNKFPQLSITSQNLIRIRTLEDIINFNKSIDNIEISSLSKQHSDQQQHHPEQNQNNMNLVYQINSNTQTSASGPSNQQSSSQPANKGSNTIEISFKPFNDNHTHLSSKHETKQRHLFESPKNKGNKSQLDLFNLPQALSAKINDSEESLKIDSSLDLDNKENLNQVQETLVRLGTLKAINKDENIINNPKQIQQSLSPHSLSSITQMQHSQLPFQQYSQQLLPFSSYLHSQQQQQQNQHQLQGGGRRFSRSNVPNYINQHISAQRFSSDFPQTSSLAIHGLTAEVAPPISQTNGLLSQLINLLGQNNGIVQNQINTSTHHKVIQIGRTQSNVNNGGGIGAPTTINNSNIHHNIGQTNKNVFIPLEDFDIQREYKYYFSSMNFSVVIVLANNYIEKLQKKKRVFKCYLKKKISIEQENIKE